MMVCLCFGVLGFRAAEFCRGSKVKMSVAGVSHEKSLHFSPEPNPETTMNLRSQSAKL